MFRVSPPQRHILGIAVPFRRSSVSCTVNICDGDFFFFSELACRVYLRVCFVKFFVSVAVEEKKKKRTIYFTC